MACDYQAIRRENERRYGTDIGRYGPMLLTDRYDDRTHFIFELLQNAEDALTRRGAWKGPRSVGFQLTNTALRFSHFGQPFTEADVRGICGIAESTKDPTAIGRFGIGFKSVFAFTDCPEIHSGPEDFAIEKYVLPVGVPQIERDPDETVILIPLKDSDSEAHGEIAHALEQLGSSTLLFLRQIDEIQWSVEGGGAGRYLRKSRGLDDELVRRVTVVGPEQAGDDSVRTWLVFSRPVSEDKGPQSGQLEIAFSLATVEDSGGEAVRRIARSLLVVFFPTVVPTDLGFLLQGPFRTTPSRDNVKHNDPWNVHLVNETGALVVEALRWLRDHDLLDATALQCLPLDRDKFPDGSMFAPLFAATKEALTSQPFLPRHRRGYVSAECARLARTEDLRSLFSAKQLGALQGHGGSICWLSGDITRDRAPELRRYLMEELDIAEETPETIVSALDKSFLEAQPDK